MCIRDRSKRLRNQMRQAFSMLEELMAGNERTPGNFLFENRLTQADITTVAGIGFVRYIQPDEWPAGEYPALEALAARLEASEAFWKVPLDE